MRRIDMVASDYRELEKKLNALAKADEDFKHRFKYNGLDKIEVKVKHGNKLTIYRTAVGRRHYSSDQRYAMRISSGWWAIAATRLLRDFDSDLVAKALFDNTKSLIPELIKKGAQDKIDKHTKELAERKSKRDRGKLKRKIERAVLSAEVTFPYGHTDDATVRVGKLNLSTVDGENFRIDRLGYGANPIPLDVLKPLLMWCMMEASIAKGGS